MAVIAMLNDKDQLGTVIPLLPIISTWYVGALTGPRGDRSSRSGYDLAFFLGATSIFELTNVALAYKVALANAKEGDRIIIFGSFHTVAEALLLEL